VRVQAIRRLPEPLHAQALDFLSSCTGIPQAVLASVCARFVIRDGCAVFKHRCEAMCRLYILKTDLAPLFSRNLKHFQNLTKEDAAVPVRIGISDAVLLLRAFLLPKEKRCYNKQ